MPKYSFKAKTIDNKIIEGHTTAVDEAEVREKLSQNQLVPISISESKSALDVEINLFGGGVSSKILQVFFRQFAVMIESGVPLVETLESLKQSTVNKKLKLALAKTQRAIETGQDLPSALAEHPKVFDPLYVDMIAAGVEGGVLDQILNRIAEYIEKKNKIKAKVMGALAYPIVVLIIAFIAVAFILVKVIPTFESMFKNAGNELPYLTQLVINLSEFFQANILYMIAGIILVIFGLGFLYTLPGPKKFFDSVFLKIPIYGSLMLKGSLARVMRTLSTLLKSGVRLNEALFTAAKISGNTLLEESFLASQDSIIKGNSFKDSMEPHHYIPTMVKQMIAVGERSGRLDDMLEKVADFYESETESAADALSSLIEPILIVFLGGIVGFLMIAMFLPVMQMAGNFSG